MDFFINDGATKISAIRAAIKSVRNTAFQPKNNPIAVKNLASPIPIASTFLYFLYRIIKEKIVIKPNNPPITESIILNSKFNVSLGKKFLKKAKKLKDNLNYQVL